MKKVVLISLSVLAMLACGNKSKSNTGDAKKAETQTENIDSSVAAKNLAIGVINTDSVLEKYQFAIDAKEKMMKKAEDARLSLNTKGQQLQKEMMDFQSKIDNNAFLSRERAEQEASRLQRKQGELEQHGAKLESDFMAEQQKLSLQLKDSISKAIAEINHDGRFAMILTTSSLTDNVLYADKSLDITGEVIELLNKRFKK